MRPHSRRRVWAVPGARWTPDGGIEATVARDQGRGFAPGQVDAHGRAVDVFNIAEAHHVDVDGEADVTCWCEATVVKVPLELVRAGLTFACDATRCRELEAKACENGDDT